MNWRRASQRRTITNYITHDIKKNCLNFGWGVGLVAWLGSVLWFDGMEMNKKSAGGDVRTKALSWDGEWDKA